MKKLFLNIILLALTTSGFSQIFPNYGGQRAGLSALSFLKNDLNPRSIAMGGASVALDYDGYSIINNPALITDFNSFNASASSMIVGSGVQQNFVSAVVPYKSKRFGISINALSTDAMEVRTEFQPYGTGEYFYATNIATGLTYAQKLSDRFAMGITFKYIFEQLAQYTNHAATADFAFSYTTDFKGLAFAVKVQDFGGNSSLKGTFTEVGFNRDSTVAVNSYTVPTIFRMGFSFLPYKSDNHSVLFAAELDHPNDNAENLRFGLAYSFKNILQIRTGYKLSVKGQKLPTFGIGLATSIGAHPFKIDYGINPTNYIGLQHVFGVSFNWNKMERE